MMQEVTLKPDDLVAVLANLKREHFIRQKKVTSVAPTGGICFVSMYVNLWPRHQGEHYSVIWDQNQNQIQWQIVITWYTHTH